MNIFDELMNNDPQFISDLLSFYYTDNFLPKHKLYIFNPCYNIVIMEKKKEPTAGSSFWQIIFPTIIGTIVILLVCVWVVIGVGAGNITRFAELSTVLLVIPVLLFFLIVMFVLGASIYLVVRLMRGLPSITSRILGFLEKIREGVGKISDFIVKPVIQPTAILRGIREVLPKKNPGTRSEN